MDDDEALLRMWTIYDHPLDDPLHYVARMWFVSAAGAVPTDRVKRSPNLDVLREMLPSGLMRMMRDPADHPSVVEVWM